MLRRRLLLVGLSVVLCLGFVAVVVTIRPAPAGAVAALRDGPAVVAVGDGSLDVFWRNPATGALGTQRFRAGGWSPPGAMVGKALLTGPAATMVAGSTRLALAVVGIDRAVYLRTRTGSTWSGWQALGGRTVRQPALVSPAAASWTCSTPASTAG